MILPVAEIQHAASLPLATPFTHSNQQLHLPIMVRLHAVVVTRIILGGGPGELPH